MTIKRWLTMDKNISTLVDIWDHKPKLVGKSWLMDDGSSETEIEKPATVLKYYRVVPTPGQCIEIRIEVPE